MFQPVFQAKELSGQNKNSFRKYSVPSFRSVHTSLFLRVLSGHDDESHVFKEMDPGAFFTFSIPFDMVGKTKVSIN